MLGRQNTLCAVKQNIRGKNGQIFIKKFRKMERRGLIGLPLLLHEEKK